MKLVQFKNSDIKKYFEKNNINKKTNLSEFEYCLYFITKNWQRYENAKQKQSIMPIKFTYKGKKTSVYELNLNLIFLKTLELTANNGLQKICKAKIKEVNSKWDTITGNSEDLKNAHNIFSAAISYTLAKSGAPIKRKANYNKKWQEFVVSENMHQPELIELQMFLMNTDHVLVQSSMAIKNREMQEKDKLEKESSITEKKQNEMKK